LPIETPGRQDYAMTSKPFIPPVGTRVEQYQPAGVFQVPGKGEAEQKFAQGAFDGSVGKVVPITMEGRTIGSGRVISADVALDGSGVTIVYEITELSDAS